MHLGTALLVASLGHPQERLVAMGSPITHRLTQVCVPDILRPRSALRVRLKAAHKKAFSESLHLLGLPVH